MKISYIASIRLPTEKAHGVQIMKTCEAVAAAGASVRLLVPRRRNRITDDPYVYYGVRPLFDIRRLFCLDALALGFWEGVGFWIGNISFALSALVSVWREKPDIVYTRDVVSAFLLPFVHPRVFYEIHSLSMSPGATFHFIWRRVHGLVVISNGLKADLVAWGVPEQRIAVIRDGVDIDRFTLEASQADCRKALGLPSDESLIVYTGHLYAWKGADTLARAAALLPENIRVYLVGGTAEDIARFRTMHHAQNLVIVGHRPSAEMPLWGRAADLLVLPNSGKEKISTHYTSPLKLFEYMASGTPMVVSDLPSMRELLGEGDAVFFSPDNDKELAERIQDALKRLTELRVRAQELRNRSSDYSWQNRGRRILELFL